MVQNNNIVVYALRPAGGAPQVPPTGQSYHLPLFALVGSFLIDARIVKILTIIS